nr:deoxyribodipyrimidine photo-lyase [Quercus suber]
MFLQLHTSGPGLSAPTGQRILRDGKIWFGLMIKRGLRDGHISRRGGSSGAFHALPLCSLLYCCTELAGCKEDWIHVVTNERVAFGGIMGSACQGIGAQVAHHTTQVYCEVFSPSHCNTSRLEIVQRKSGNPVELLQDRRCDLKHDIIHLECQHSLPNLASRNAGLGSLWYVIDSGGSFAPIEALLRVARTMAPKRRATSPVRPPPSKKQATTKLNPDGEHDETRNPREDDIVARAFYPPEMSNERCARYNNGELPRPMAVLDDLIKSTSQSRSAIPVGDAVVHWFKRDLRLSDNRALHLASERAKSKNVPLICMFVVSPQDYEAHVTSARRVDFELRTLEVMKSDLAELNIPLYTTTILERKNVTSHILEKCQEWGAKQIFCNIEYEVDELRREAKLLKLCLENEIDFLAVHDDVVVSPGTLVTGSGNQYSVYSPWHRAWTKHIHANPHLLDPFPVPSPNPESAKHTHPSIFSCPIPHAPANKTLPPEGKTRMAHLWPASEHEAHARLQKFLTERLTSYKETRNLPAVNSTSSLSVHFSAGTLSARSAIHAARAANSTRALDGGNIGIQTWIAELGWRDFYKHVLAHWPYVCMSKPFKYEYSGIQWERDAAQFAAWREGRTGFPIVDAAMRQLRSIGWMHNRSRMIVASFLAKDLLLDWRVGERYFMTALIDGDFASNNGGWGFAASTGVDPQPYFRIFNPLLQSEKFDPDGAYIRKWVPELREVLGKAVHDPYGRGAAKQAEDAGYPKPIVEHRFARNRALERYKSGLGRNTANVGGGVHN